MPERFDALLVDEGQDFTERYWRCLQRLLADPATARVYVFRDEAQDVFGGGGGSGGGGGGAAGGGEAGLLTGVPEYRLFDNCRNTRSIHAVSRALADDETEALGPEGRAPEFILVEEAGEAARLAEGVRPEQIAVLTAARRWLGALAPFGCHPDAYYPPVPDAYFPPSSHEARSARRGSCMSRRVRLA